MAYCLGSGHGSYGNSRRNATSGPVSRKFLLGRRVSTQSRKPEEENVDYSDEELWGEQASSESETTSSIHPKLLSTPRQKVQPKRLYPMFEKRPVEYKKKLFSHVDSGVEQNYSPKNMHISDQNANNLPRKKFSYFDSSEFSMSSNGKQLAKRLPMFPSSSQGTQMAEQPIRHFPESNTPKPNLFVTWSVSNKGKKFPKTQSRSLPPFLITVSISNLKKWNGPSPNGSVLFELFGKIEVIAPSNQTGVKYFTLRGENSAETRCVFYEIDRSMPKIEQGKIQRCLGIRRRGCPFHCISIRSARPVEIESFEKVADICGARVPAVVQFLREQFLRENYRR